MHLLQGGLSLSLLLRQACTDFLTLHSTFFGVHFQIGVLLHDFSGVFLTYWCKRFLESHCPKGGISSLANAVG